MHKCNVIKFIVLINYENSLGKLCLLFTGNFFKALSCKKFCSVWSVSVFSTLMRGNCYVNVGLTIGLRESITNISVSYSLSQPSINIFWYKRLIIAHAETVYFEEWQTSDFRR